MNDLKQVKLFFHKFSFNKTQYLTKVLSPNCTADALYRKGGLQLAHGLFLMIFTNAFYRLIDFCDSLRVTCVNVFKLDLRSRFESFPKILYSYYNKNQRNKILIFVQNIWKTCLLKNVFKQNHLLGDLFMRAPIYDPIKNSDNS